MWVKLGRKEREERGEMRKGLTRRSLSRSFTPLALDRGIGYPISWHEEEEHWCPHPIVQSPTGSRSMNLVSTSLRTIRVRWRLTRLRGPALKWLNKAQGCCVNLWRSAFLCGSFFSSSISWSWSWNYWSYEEQEGDDLGRENLNHVENLIFDLRRSMLKMSECLLNNFVCCWKTGRKV